MSRSPPLYSFKDVLGLFGSPGPGCDPGTLFLGEAHWNNPLQSRVHSEAHTTDTRRGTPVSKDHKHQTKRNHLASAKHRQRRFGRAIVLWGAYLAFLFFFSLFFFSKKEFFFNFPFLDASCFPLLVSCTRLLWPTGEGRTWTHPASNGILPNSDTHPRAHTYTLTHPLYLFFPSFDSTAIYAERADIERSGGFCIDSPRLLFLTRV